MWVAAWLHFNYSVMTFRFFDERQMFISKEVDNWNAHDHAH